MSATAGVGVLTSANRKERAAELSAAQTEALQAPEDRIAEYERKAAEADPNFWTAKADAEREKLAVKVEADNAARAEALARIEEAIAAYDHEPFLCALDKVIAEGRKLEGWRAEIRAAESQLRKLGADIPELPRTLAQVGSRDSDRLRLYRDASFYVQIEA